MQENNEQNIAANIQKIKRWSPVWIVPIVTVLIGLWIIFYHFSHQGPEITLITTNAEGLQAGKTAIKSRSVDIGSVTAISLSEDLSTVTIKARLKLGMENLLRKDTLFWVVKPQIGREGVSGLGTLFSGAYIELQPGKASAEQYNFTLVDSPPLSSHDTPGIRIKLESKQTGRLNTGDPVLFRGFRVGSVENAELDPNSRLMNYQLFIEAPYDRLVTSNVRFWPENGVSFNMSTEGVKLDIGSFSTLLNGGVNFDVPEGWSLGAQAKNNDRYELFTDKKSIQESLFTHHVDFLVLFNDSVRGLQAGAPVEFRGIRLGTVAQVPFLLPKMVAKGEEDYQIPVLIRIEPDRLYEKFGTHFDIKQYLLESEQYGLRAALKSANLITGALYVDLDFYPDAQPWIGMKNIQDYPVIPSERVGLAQIQQKIVQLLDKFNALPLESTMLQTNNTLRDMQKTLNTLNQLVASESMQKLPNDLQQTLLELNRGLKGLQPGSPMYNKLLTDMQRLDLVLRELQPILRTLNNKSNALIFQAPINQDPVPKKAKK